jgi:flagellar biosynthesis/type III secretory pathway protein FliH
MGIAEILQEDARIEGLEKGLKQGRSQGLKLGREEGINKGKIEGKIEVIENLIQEFPEWNDARIARLANASEELVASIRTRLTK